MMMMKLLAVLSTKLSYPTGSKSFAVQQAFPGASLTPEQTDPFLMCDFFGPSISRGEELDPDRFPVGWHPHRGMDVVTYLVEGIGRHADSMGNRETFASPGMQWCRAASGIEHAEGGGTPAGQANTGFQIWINSPAHKKMDPPAYGTEPPERMPVVPVGGNNTCGGGGGTVRVLCGEYLGHHGPLQPSHENAVQILDVRLQAGSDWEHTIPPSFDTCFVLVYNGSGAVHDDAGSSSSLRPVGKNNVLWFDAASVQPGGARKLAFRADGGGGPLSLMVFAGRKLKQPVAWHGPFVMNTQREIEQAMYEYQHGTFLRFHAPWDYKRLASKI